MGQFHGVGGMQNDMFIVIAFQDIEGLAIVDPDAYVGSAIHHDKQKRKGQVRVARISMDRGAGKDY